MIYLIDDKKDRQKNDYNWPFSRLNEYNEILQPIYDLRELQENRNQVFESAKVIMYHESFIDKSVFSEQAAQKRKELRKYAQKKDKLLIYFSGGSDTRKIEGNIAYISDSTLYQNLEIFLKAYKNNDTNLEYLVYGSDPKLEQKLKDKQKELLKKIENEEIKEVTGKHNLFLRPINDFISNPITNADIETLWEASDVYLNEFLEDKLQKRQYDNVFIPLSFGETNSDFNGLKLALNIRCTKTLNQCSNLYIYGFVKFSFIVNHKYFDILKTKNVKMIDFSKKAIYDSAIKTRVKITENELSNEISKVKLNYPKNYMDNHSVANEWAIYQWAKTIRCDKTDELAKVFQNVENNLYFKYLKTINPIFDPKEFNNDLLKIKYKGSPRVLLIDDESDKGWGELIAYILEDCNDIYTDYLGYDFKNKDSKQIEIECIKKIEKDNINLVILDFRLNSTDFVETNPEKITSTKILRAIKGLNPGIQVIIFSATDKVWNLQALQIAGADSFIFKGLNEWGANSTTVVTMVKQIKQSIKRLFLKDLFQIIFQIKKNLKAVDYVDETDFEKFVLDLLTHIKIIEEACKQITLERKSTLDIVFLSCYNLLEQFKSYYISYKDYSYVLGIDEIDMVRYSPAGKKIINVGVFTPNNQYDKPSWFNSLASISIDYLQICNLNDDLIKKLAKVKTKRNDFIHGNKNHFDQNELKMILNIITVITKKFKE